MAHDPDQPREDTSGPPHRHRIGDHLWYIHPRTDERFLSVTSVLEMRAREDLDHRWRPACAAKAAFAHLPKLIVASITPDCGQTYGRCSRKDTRQHDWRERCDACPCEACERCVVKWLTYEHYRESAKATTRGSAVHDWKQAWLQNGGDTALAWNIFRAASRLRDDALQAWVDEIRPYTESFLRFVDDYGLSPRSWEMTEATILNRRHMYGGTLDGRIEVDATASRKALELCERFGAARILVSEDTKSREKEEGTFYEEMALQLAPYRRGEVVLLPNGDEEPFAPDDGAVVLQLRPNGYGLRPVVTDDVTFDGFLGALAIARWSIEYAYKSVLVRTFPRTELPGITKPKPAKKAAPRKTTAAKKTAPAAVPVVKQHLDSDVASVAGRPVQDVPLPLDVPGGGQTRLQQAAAEQSATLRSMRTAPGKPAPHPNSPPQYNDEIPF